MSPALKSTALVRSPRLARLLHYRYANHFACESNRFKNIISVEMLERPESSIPPRTLVARVKTIVWIGGMARLFS